MKYFGVIEVGEYLQKNKFARFNSRSVLDFCSCLDSVSRFLPGQLPLLLSCLYFLFTFEFSQEFLVYPCRSSGIFAWFPACLNGPLEEIFLKNLFSITLGILPSRPLNEPNSALLKARVVILPSCFYALLLGSWNPLSQGCPWSSQPQQFLPSL